MSEPINRVFTNFLDRMLDESAKSAESMSQLRSTIAELREEIHEIKGHVSSEANKDQDAIRELRVTMNQMLLRMESEEEKRQHAESFKKLADFIDWVKNPKTWVSIFVAFVVATASLIGGVAAVVSKLEPYLQHSNSAQTTNTSVKQPNTP